jgi:RNA polymerase sigma-70 factor (ECF subfamily)
MASRSEPIEQRTDRKEFSEAHRDSVECLYVRANAERWQLPGTKFAATLERSVQHRFQGSQPSEREVDAYLDSLHLEDLALACACAEGNEAAWDHFVREFRPVLHAAARAIAGESAAPELADSMYAELYGLESDAAGKRTRSLFEYFHGRSKLSTWLRAVLAQRHVDSLRTARRTEPLTEDNAESGVANPPAAAFALPPDPDRSRYLNLLEGALTAALAALAPRDQLRLAYYYVQELTLAQIGRLLGEHEATVSRKLERTRRDLRKQVEQALRDPQASGRLSEAQIRLCFEYALEEWPFDLTSAFSARPVRARQDRNA